MNLLLEAEMGPRMHRICILTFEMGRRLFYKAGIGCSKTRQLPWVLFRRSKTTNPCQATANSPSSTRYASR